MFIIEEILTESVSFKDESTLYQLNVNTKYELWKRLISQKYPKSGFLKNYRFLFLGFFSFRVLQTIESLSEPRFMSVSLSTVDEAHLSAIGSLVSSNIFLQFVQAREFRPYIYYIPVRNVSLIFEFLLSIGFSIILHFYLSFLLTPKVGIDKEYIKSFIRIYKFDTPST